MVVLACPAILCYPSLQKVGECDQLTVNVTRLRVAGYGGGWLHVMRVLVEPTGPLEVDPLVPGKPLVDPGTLAFEDSSGGPRHHGTEASRPHGALTF